MNRNTYAGLYAGLLMTVAISACTPTTSSTATPTLQPVVTTAPTIEPQPTSTSMPATPTPTATAVPTLTPTAWPNTEYISYLDDRSDAATVIESLFNAVTLHQYARAYAYWADTPQRPDFQQFEAGYQDTAAVTLTLDTITGDIGAGQLYSSVPVTLIAMTTSGATQTFVGCYVLHLSQPAVQGIAPFRPWGIQSATVTQVDNNANTTDLMSQACAVTGQPVPPQPTADPGSASADQYLDNRSGPGELIHSLYNAINRHEYVRAYSYWESTAPNLPNLDDFTQGYSTTQAVTVTLGTVTPDAGAGQIHYRVPATLIADQTDGTRQTFVGCYILHISNPDIQAAPPFHPLAIQSADVKPVANDADTQTLMNQMCALR